MGAWSAENFSNDTALDFLAEIASLDDLRRPIETMMSSTSEYIEADMAAEVLTAADLLAGMLGRPAPDMPKEANALISTFGKPTSDLLGAARAAARRVRDESELAELWDEGDDEEWKEVVNDLILRLDPEIAYKPKKQKPVAKGGFVCSVCDDIVPNAQLIKVEIGFLNLPGISMGRYFHRRCIEANFKPPYFYKNGEVRGSLKRQIKRFLAKKDKDQADH